MPKLYHNVAPRYSAGSPAQVDQRTADRVAAEERRSYVHALEGYYGEEAKREAETLGLAAIVWTSHEIGSKLRKEDVLTGTITEQRIDRHGGLSAPVVIRQGN